MGNHRAEWRPAVPTRSVAAIVLAVLAVVVVGGVALWQSTQSSSAASEPEASSEDPGTAALRIPGLRRLVVAGHSMPLGGGASDESLGYTEVVAEVTGLKVVNLAEGRTTARDTADTIASAPAAGRHDAVVVHTGVNDIFRWRRGDPAVLGRDDVRRLLEESSSAGRQVVILECQPTSWLDTPPGIDLQASYDAWNAMLRQEAEAAGADVLDTCAEWDPQQYAERFHPNDAGHSLIAQELVEVLAGS